MGWACTQAKIASMRFKIFEDFIYLLLEREGGKKRERETSVWERNIDRLPLACTPTGAPTHNPGMCPVWELNQWPSVFRTTLQPARARHLLMGLCSSGLYPRRMWLKHRTRLVAHPEILLRVGRQRVPCAYLFFQFFTLTGQKQVHKLYTHTRMHVHTHTHRRTMERNEVQLACTWDAL